MTRKYTKREKIADSMTYIPAPLFVPTELGKAEEKKIPFTQDQYFHNAEGAKIPLSDFLVEGDWWEQKKKNSILIILTHAAVQKIAKYAGLSCQKYEILTQPTVYNNQQYTMQCTIVDCKGNICDPELGEANNNNLGRRGKNNPAAMAQKRAFDRTVLKHLGIRGVLSEEELADSNEENEHMDDLNHDERKKIAGLINSINLAKSKSELNRMNVVIPEQKIVLKLEEKELIYLRKLFNKRMGEIINAQKF